MFESLQPVSYAVVSIFFFLSSTTILLRIYSRGFMVKSFGLDDWCMTSILFFNAGQQVLLYYFLHYGGGLHFMTVVTTHPEWLVNLTYALFVEEIYYIWMHWVIKTAFLLFYLRFATTRTFKNIICGTMVLNTVFAIITWLIYVRQCDPLDAYFHPAAHPNAKCLDRAVQAYVPAAFSAFVDILILVIPIRPLWAIQVSVRKRITLISIVSLGGLVVIVSLLRLIVLHEFEKQIDLTYTLGKLIIISSIELDLAIIAANAPSLKVYWTRYVSKTATTRRSDVESHTLSTLKGRKQMTQGSICHISSNNMISKVITPEREEEERTETSQGRGDSSSNESQEKLWSDDRYIMVTSSVGVSVAEVPAPQKEEGHSRYYAFDRS